MKNVIVIGQRSMERGWKGVRESLSRLLGFARSYPVQTSIMIS